MCRAASAGRCSRNLGAATAGASIGIALAVHWLVADASSVVGAASSAVDVTSSAVAVASSVVADKTRRPSNLLPGP